MVNIALYIFSLFFSGEFAQYILQVSMNLDTVQLLFNHEYYKSF
jgi:hypothetical protein